MGSSDQRRTKKKTKAQKELGKAALRAILKNQEVADEFLQALRAGRLPENLHLGKVIRAVGGGRFEVEIDGVPTLAGLSGILLGRGGFFRNPEAATAVRADAYVVVEDIGLGPYAAGKTHEIIAVLDRGQAAEARKIARIWDLGTASSSNSVYSSSELIEHVTAIREPQLAEVRRKMAGLQPGGAAAAAITASQVAVAAAEEAVSAAAVAEAAASVASEESENIPLTKEQLNREAKAARSRRRRATKQAAARAAAGGGGGKM